MLRLRRLRVREFGCFEDKQVDFHPRMNLIVGPNGSGKSTLMRAVKGALTGTFDDRCTKEEAVRSLCPKGKTSDVELEVEGHGFQALIKRSLKTANTSLSVGNADGTGRSLTSFASVNAEILKMLGVSKYVMDQFLFADQGAIDSVLKGTRAARQEALAKLLGLDKLAKVHDAANSRAVTLEPSAALVDNWREQRHSVRVALEQKQSEMQEIYREIGMLGGAAGYRREDDPDYLLTQRYSLQQQALSELVVAEKRYGELSAARGQLAAVVESASKDHTEISGAIQLGVDHVAAARLAIEHWRRRKSALQSVEKLQIDAANVEIQLARVEDAEPKTPEGYLPPDQRQAVFTEIANLERVRSDAQKVLSAPTTCHACGQPLPGSSEERVADAMRQIQEASERLRVLNGSANGWREYDRRHGSWLQSADALRRQLLATRQAAGVIEVPPIPVVPEQEARDIVAQDDVLRMELHQASDGLAKAQSTLAAHDARMVDCDARVQELLRNIPDPLITEAQNADALRNFQSRGDLFGRYQDLTRQRDIVSVDIARLGREAVDLDAKLIDAEAKARAALLARQLACVFHRTGLGAEVAASSLRATAGRVVDFLRDFQAPFSVRISDDDGGSANGFTVDKVDGSSHPSDQLSGGQMVMLAIAYRCAMNSLYAADAGLLLMDEPTVFLDEASVGNLNGVLSRLRELAGAQGLQVVVVSHERSIAGSFDNVIDLSR